MADDRKLDSLFLWADRMYSAGRFAEVDAVLARVNIDKLSDSLIHGWLCVAWWPEMSSRNRGKVPARTQLHERVARVWSTRRPELLTAVRNSARGFFTA